MNSSPHKNSLVFASSSSEMVGIDSPLVDKLRKSALKTSAYLKIPTFISVAGSGIANSDAVLILASIFLLASQGVVLAFGNKKTADNLAEMDETPSYLQQNNIETNQEEPSGTEKIIQDIKKAMQPDKYPVEASGLLLIIGSLLTTASGVLTGHPAQVALGMIAAVASSIIVFIDEKNENNIAISDKEKTEELLKSGPTTGDCSTEAENAPHKKFIDNIKEQPVRTASIMGIAVGGLSIVRAFSDSETDIGFLVSGVLAIISNGLMAIFVKKNDYNIEGENKATPRPKIEKATVQNREKLNEPHNIGYHTGI